MAYPGLAQDVLYSCTHMATMGVKWLNYVQKGHLHVMLISRPASAIYFEFSCVPRIILLFNGQLSI